MKNVLIALGLFFAPQIAAASVVDVVDIDAQINGGLPGQPLANVFAPLYLDAGSYQVSVTDGIFQSMLLRQPIEGCSVSGDACDPGYVVTYVIHDPFDNFLFFYEPSAFDPLRQYATPEAALAAAQADGPQNFYAPTSGIYYFGVYDDITDDNIGGVSLEISVVPLGGAMIFLASCLGGLLGIRLFGQSSATA